MIATLLSARASALMAHQNVCVLRVLFKEKDYNECQNVGNLDEKQ
jgi:hypothetical protein